MIQQFDWMVCGTIGVEYLLDLNSWPHLGTRSVIRREVRAVGGSGARCVLALQQQLPNSARIGLIGTALGDDGNGRFVRRELETHDHLTLLTPSITASEETLFWVRLQAPDGSALLEYHGAQTEEAAASPLSASTLKGVDAKYLQEIFDSITCRSFVCEESFAALCAPLCQARGIALHCWREPQIGTPQEFAAEQKFFQHLASNAVT